MLFKTQSAVVALGLLPLIGSVATVAAAETSSFNQVFQSIPASKPGSCASYDMDSVTTDALTLCNNAIAALQTLTATNGISNSKKNVDRLEMAQTVWGIDWNPSKFGFMGGKHTITQGMNYLTTAMSNLQKVQTMLKSTSPGDAKAVCGDTDWLWVTKRKDWGYVTDADQLISEFWGLDPNNHPGFWMSNYFSSYMKDKSGQDTKMRSQQGMIIINDEGSTSAEDNICKPNPQLAETWMNGNNVIMLCDGVLGLNSVQDAINSQSSLSPGSSIDDSARIAGAYLLHELMHYTSNRVIGDTIVGQREVGGKKVGGQKAYDWDAVAAVSYEGKDPTENADNYRMWAVGTTLDQVQWSLEGRVQ